MIEMPFQLKVGVVWWMKIIQLLFALACAIGAVFVLIIKINGSDASLLVFFLLSFLAYLGWGNGQATIHVTEESVTVTVFYGRFRILWREVETIAFNAPLIAILGNDKSVILSLALLDKKRGKMIEYFRHQIDARKIQLVQDIHPFPMSHRNARVWW